MQENIDIRSQLAGIRDFGSNGTDQSVPFPVDEKKDSTICRKKFIENSIQMVSARSLLRAVEFPMLWTERKTTQSTPRTHRNSMMMKKWRMSSRRTANMRLMASVFLVES